MTTSSNFQASNIAGFIIWVSLKKAIILKGKGIIVIVEKKHSRNSQEAQNGYCDAFDFASPNPWIPMIPDSGKDPHLDKDWEENDYSLQLIGKQAD